MMFLGRSPWLWVVAGLFALPAPVRAEEDVRIAIVERAAKISVGGEDLVVFDAATGQRITAWAGPMRVEVRANGKSGVQVLAGKATSAAATGVLFEAKEGLEVDGTLYLGRVGISRDGGGLWAINRLPLETYLLGIVGSEMNPLWPMEALKAQAVAARTYAMQRRMMMRAANRSYDLASTVLSQVYKGAERIRPSVIEAVRETRGEVLGYRHDLVEALFHSTCGGKTVSAKAVFGRDVPYLRAQDCRWCRDSTKHRWRMSLSLGELSKKLQRAKLTRGTLKSFERAAKAIQVSVRDGAAKRTLSPLHVRRALGYDNLYSDRFVAETKGQKVQISGQGFGHGVGMCQWGARGMAEEGRSYRAILEHYYRGAQVERIY